MASVSLSPNGVDRYAGGPPPDGLLVATVDGVIELRREGERWRETARALQGVHVSALLVTPDGDAFAGSHGAGIFRREGAQWRVASTGLSTANVFSLASTGYGDRLVLFAGTEPALLFRSGDRGARWEELPALRAVPGRETWNFPAPPHVAHTKHIDVDPRDDEVLYLSIEQGALLKTTDGGRTLRELPFHDASYRYYKDAHRIAINPDDPDELLLSGGDGISRSRDAGETWERVTTPAMRVGYPDATFFAPDGRTIFTAGSGTAPGEWRRTGDATAAMARSRDGGRTWETLALPPLRGNIEAATQVCGPNGYGFFAGTTDGEVFFSPDAGERWELIASGLPAISKCIHARNLEIGRGAA